MRALILHRNIVLDQQLVGFHCLRISSLKPFQPTHPSSIPFINATRRIKTEIPPFTRLLLNRLAELIHRPMDSPSGHRQAGYIRVIDQ